MLKALVCLFAVYGLGCFIYFKIRTRLKPAIPSLARVADPDEVVLHVRDAEEQIEGLVREFFKAEGHSPHPRRLTVIDTGSQDQTTEILERLVYRFPYLSIKHYTNRSEVPPSEG